MANLMLFLIDWSSKVECMEGYNHFVENLQRKTLQQLLIFRTGRYFSGMLLELSLFIESET